MIRTSIIGISGFGDTHYNDLARYQKDGKLEITAAAVINQDEEKEKCSYLRSLGCKLFTDYRQMLDETSGKVDLCFIPTGIPMHRPMTVAALRSGANVFLEKPAAATVQEVEEMKKAQRESGKFAAVGYQTMYTPELMRIKKDIVAGKIGRLRSVKCYALWPRADDYYGRNNWAGRLKSGDSWVLDSPYNNALAHQLNQICFFAGEKSAGSAEIKSVEAELYRANRIESADTACARIMTKSGIPLYFIATHACQTFAGPDIVITGDKGEITWNMQKTVFKYGSAGEELPSQNWDEMRISVMDSLIARIKDPSAFTCTLDIAGVQTLCVNGIHESSPIHALDEKLFQRIPHKDSCLTVINDIDSVVLAAFKEEKLFSELGVAWAHRGRTIDLKGYNCFPMPGSRQ
ncbi:MAG TPA: hypothetical protein DET40_16790 [Lentisphaeria bacterium]|nr:MAG: hypothetical protein A2X45_04595 [Lentisphaerae bacterium GWF2_50_93]HCE45198.1 hypothetical protein [Lentisphaeria bacterium]